MGPVLSKNLQGYSKADMKKYPSEAEPLISKKDKVKEKTSYNNKVYKPYYDPQRYGYKKL